MNTNNEPQKNSIENILEKIKKNELAIKPKTYFRLKLVALVLVSVLTFIISIFLFSFILFTLRASGHAALIGFGPSGSHVFLALFPWKLLLFDIVLLLIVGWLVRSFRFGYKSSVLTVV